MVALHSLLLLMYGPEGGSTLMAVGVPLAVADQVGSSSRGGYVQNCGEPILRDGRGWVLLSRVGGEERVSRGAVETGEVRW